MSCPKELDSDNYSYAHLHKSINGGYYYLIGNTLKFTYDEEYSTTGTGPNLSYMIYDKGNNLIAGFDALGNSLQNGSPALEKNFGYNQYYMDLSNVSLNQGEYYVLEVRNDKNDVKYLRFRL